MEADMKGYSFPLKKLTLANLPNLKQIWCRNCEGILSFQNLREVLVTKCEQLKSLFPAKLAKRIEKLEKLEIRQCAMFLEIVEEDYTEEFSFPRLTSLELRTLPQLTWFYLGKANFILESLKLDWKNTSTLLNKHFPEFMLHELVELELDFDDVNEKLCVSLSPDLITLVNSAVSFSNLKQLFVKDCHGLKHLFTSSTARNLVHLEEMNIVQCQSMEEILTKDPEEGTSEAIKFKRLNTIVLDTLPRLLCFYSGNDILSLSSLRIVWILECPNVEFFSRGNVEAESFQGIQVSSDQNGDLPIPYKDINTAVKMFHHRYLQQLFEAVDWDEDVFARGKNTAGGQQSKWLHLCDLEALKLHKWIIPYAISSAILHLLKNLKQLEVRDSPVVEVIFDMRGIKTMEMAFRLKKLNLHGLSKLRQIWDKNCEGVLIFPNLQEVVVSNCGNLQTLFPASLARNLKQLQKLEIKSCDKLQAIFEKEEETDVTEKFVFSRLQKLNLQNLPLLSYFYPQTFTLECPGLKILSVLDCDELELFQSAHSMGKGEGTSSSVIRQPLVSNLKVISNLEELVLDWKHVSTLSLRFRSGKFMEDLDYLKKISLYLDANENEKPILPIKILQKVPNLAEMTINTWNGPEIFLDANPKISENRIVGQLKILTLNKVSVLQSIESENSSQRNTIFEKIQELYVDSCPHLTTLIHSTSTISFSFLKEVSISNCDDLQYLFTSSAAKKLMNLEKIKVEECGSLKEIVAEKGVATSEAIEFKRLNTVVLHLLPSLRCFYFGTETLLLPSLMTVHIWKCLNIKFFSQGIIYAESFKGVQTLFTDPDLFLYQDLNAAADPDLLFHQDLSATVKAQLQRREFFDAMAKMGVRSNYWLEADRLNVVSVSLQNGWLHNLRALKLDECILSHVIPYAILCLLNNLEDLEVRDSDEVKVIFYINDTDQVLETPLKLKKLTLQRLSELAHVWGKSSKGVPIFPCLLEVFVRDCGNLRALFSVSVAKNLQQLEKLEIESCYKLKKIVEKEEGGTTANITEQFVFPHLKKLVLLCLPRLAHFYPQTFTLECPTLKILSVLDCDKLELFHFMAEGEDTSSSINTTSLVSNQMVISNLKELTLDWKHISTLSLMFRSRNFMEDLNRIRRISMFFEADENEEPMLPVEIFQKAPNLIEIVVNDCNNPKTLFALNPNIGEEDGLLERLKVLKLYHVSMLLSIELDEQSWLNPISKKIQRLHVGHCSHLRTLVRSTSIGSFSCLKKVSIFNCPQLQYLFTSSVAEKLINLENINVKECESVKEIVAKEGDATLEAIEFKQLNTIVLHSLPNLECFYSGSDTLQLLSLETVYMTKCSNIKFFSQGDIHAESFQGIQMSSDTDDELLFHQDLNATIKVKLQRQEFFDAMVDTRSRSDHWPEADGLNNASVSTQNEWLRELRSLKLCNFILPYVIPSAIFHLLNNIEELEVRDSHKVEVIFDMNGTEVMETQSQLKKLTLQKLPELRRVWGKNDQGIITFPNLQEFVVSNCENLQTLLPVSLAKNLEGLEKLEIKSCPKLQQIVKKEEKLTTLEEITVKDCGPVNEIVAKEGDEDEHKGQGGDKHENELIFGKLEILNLDSLPKFESFYTGSLTLNFPSLKEMEFTKCYGVKIFRHGDKMPAELKVTIDGVHCEDDIKSAIMKQSEEVTNSLDLFEIIV
ncbi:hypothetical protein Fmac_011817 [Flemingia macrophylla]|uniref:Disease resistance protein At4g27190-like leucine-rich repeats domain-containing protein n=1 Tax=Flemingia macrophylla TaxID=520843 RepID=A0ABD1MNJ0_9FABA